jgi:transcriptional regulator GlxA family with amidase domain
MVFGLRQNCKLAARGATMLVTVYAPELVHAVDLAAICDALALANLNVAASSRYDVRIVGPRAGALRSGSGLTIMPDFPFDACADAADLLIVCPGDRLNAKPEPALTLWLQHQAEGAKRYGAIGNGAFLVGSAGLLDGRRVTTHWQCSSDLAAAFPATIVEPDRIYVRDGRLFSCAGGLAAIDLMLALIEEDHGRELALKLARHFILFMKRSGAQAQLSLSLETQATTRDPIQRVQHHIRDNMAGDLTVTALAAVAAMSPRNFARVFVQETALRPADYVEIMRVNLARRMLEETSLPPQQIARLCGFSGSEAARRAFRRRAGMTMTEFRARLHDGGGSA